MTFVLQSLIKEASMELGSDACQQGKHQWRSEGGRSCPKDLTDLCSQSVYRCAICGTYDYGATGGPGANDCITYCHHKRDAPITAYYRDRNRGGWASPQTQGYTQ